MDGIKSLEGGMEAIGKEIELKIGQSQREHELAMGRKDAEITLMVFKVESSH